MRLRPIVGQPGSNSIISRVKLGQTTVQLRKRAGFYDLWHRLGDHHRRTDQCLYQRSRGIWKKIIENGRSGQLLWTLGQSSRMKESWSNTLLNGCIRMDSRWNKKADSRSSPDCWVIFFLTDNVRSYKPTHWSDRAFQQRLAESESWQSER